MWQKKLRAERQVLIRRKSNQVLRLLDKNDQAYYRAPSFALFEFLQSSEQGREALEKGWVDSVRQLSQLLGRPPFLKQPVEQNARVTGWYQVGQLQVRRAQKIGYHRNMGGFDFRPVKDESSALESLLTMFEEVE